jgi:hypothetical protein
MKAECFEEQLLEFGSDQLVEHPQDGLFLYGPIQVKGSRAVVNVGAVDTRSGIDLITRWIKKARRSHSRPESRRPTHVSLARVSI